MPQMGLNGRTIYHPRGRVVGGSSAVNIGAWLRGVKQDYEWEQYGAMGWNWQTAQELFTSVIEDTDLGPNDYRGRGGMVYMTDAMQYGDVTDKLIDSFVAVGFGGMDDPYGADPFNARRMQIIYQDHRRKTPADSYLSENVRARDNLDVITGAMVTRIIFDERRATGVEFIKDGKTHIMPVNGEVILSAGTYNTPKILMLSGVGPVDEITRHGIDVVANVPGVGQNLSDHIFVHFRVLAPEGMDYSLPMSIITNDESIKLWREFKTGPADYFTENTIGLMKLDDASETPDFELIFGFNSGGTSDMLEFANISNLDGRSGYSIGVVLLQPESRGNVTLESSDPMAKPIIDPNYLGNANDVQKFVAGVRKTMDIFDADAIRPYTDIIRISPESTDGEIENFIRTSLSTTFHPVGTARMGNFDDPMVVVDSDLRVRGLDNVRIADVSVMPVLNHGHTMAHAVYIGEMAARRIKQDIPVEMNMPTVDTIEPIVITNDMEM